MSGELKEIEGKAGPTLKARVLVERQGCGLHPESCGKYSESFCRQYNSIDEPVVLVQGSKSKSTIGDRLPHCGHPER